MLNQLRQVYASQFTLRALYFIQRRNYFPPISLRLRRIKVRKQQILGRDMQAQLLMKYTRQPLYNVYRVLIPCLIPATLYNVSIQFAVSITFDKADVSTILEKHENYRNFSQTVLRF